MDWKFQSETLQHFDKSRFVGIVAVYHYKCLLQNCFINLMDEIALDIHDIASYLKKLVIQKNPSRLRLTSILSTNIWVYVNRLQAYYNRQNTLSKCSSGHQILHRGLKLDSMNSAKWSKKIKIHRSQIIFHRGGRQKLSRIFT